MHPATDGVTVSTPPPLWVIPPPLSVSLAPPTVCEGFSLLAVQVGAEQSLLEEINSVCVCVSQVN